MRKNIFSIILWLLILTVVCAGGYFVSHSIRSMPMELPPISEPETDYSEQLEIDTGEQKIAINTELALTEQQQMTGMMYRTEMGDNDGMLFVFTDENIRSFWMRNTLISLDMLFIDKDGKVVSIYRNAVPEDETLVSSQLPAKAVLEVKGGMAEKWGVKPGATIKAEALTK